MCGIAGALSIDGDAEPARLRELVQAMLAQMHHRGPDGEGIRGDRTVALGHRRLAIIDPTDAGAQPMTDPQDQVWVVANGMIYNYRALQAEARLAGYPLRSVSDSEVIVPQYLAHGAGCVARFNGMWGLALWDRRRQSLFLSRDRIGVKPLYWAQADRTIVFASELTALLPVLPGPIEHDLDYLAKLCRWGIDDPARSPVRGVHLVPPGHTVRFTREGVRTIEPYWAWKTLAPGERAIAREAEVVEQLRSRFAAAVERRMRADAPIVYFLSGGLDSGAVVGVASRRSEAPLRTLSSVSDLPGFDEREYIDDFVAHYRTDAEFISPAPRGALLDELPRIVHHLGGPGAGQGAYTQWWLFKRARELGAKVVLTGSGGDEVLGGYHTYLRPYLSSLARDYGEHHRRRDLMRLLWDAYQFRRALGRSYLFNDALASFEGRELIWMQRFRAWLERGVDRPEAPPRWLSQGLHDRAHGLRAPHCAGIEEQLREGLLHTIMPGWLRNEDRIGMAWSIEVRHPFLDVELVEFLGLVDHRLKIRGLSTKHLLRRAMRGVMPARPRKRRDKMGLPTPLAHWLRTSERDAVQGYLEDAGRRHPEVFDGAGLRALFEQHQAGRDHSKPLFTALTTSLWMDEIAAIRRTTAARDAPG